jgi:tRNA threonylcarbamoyladenosine biosynthesis protein TsaB
VKILALDTSTIHAGVAVRIAQGEDVHVFEKREHVTTHSEKLLLLIDAAMREAGVTPRELDLIACGAGPGSFTGLRIGLATAKGLCFATGKPLVLVSSLATLAARAPEGATVCATLDAYKSEVYAGLFRVEHGKPVPLGDEQVLPPSALKAQLDALGPSVVVVGEGAHRYPEVGEGRTLLDYDVAPRPGDLARLAAVRADRNDFDDLAAAGPRYIRPSEPELQRMKRDKLADK